MPHRIHDFDDETITIVNQDATERRRAHHRDAMRDLVIAALGRVLNDDGFTHGPWFDNSYPETVHGSLIPVVINPYHDKQCEIVSPTRKFTLYTHDLYDDLLGINDQGNVAHYDVDELLDNDKLVEEEQEPLTSGCF